MVLFHSAAKKKTVPQTRPGEKPGADGLVEASEPRVRPNSARQVRVDPRRLIGLRRRRGVRLAGPYKAVCGLWVWVFGGLESEV